MSHKSLVLAVGMGIFLLAGIANGQAVYGGNNNLPPFGGFSGSDFDIVSLQNGNLHISIPILVIPQRGLKPITYKYLYDSQSYVRTFYISPVRVTVAFNDDYAGWDLRRSTQWGTRATDQKMQCFAPNGTYFLRSYTIVDPDRAKHPVPVYFPTNPDCSTTLANLSGVAFDGTGTLLDSNTGGRGLLLKDGTSGGRDTNGNAMDSIAGIDTLGRTLPVAADGPSITYTTPLGRSIGGPQFTTWTYSDSDGVARTWRVDYTALDMNTGFCSGQPNCTDLTTRLSGSRVVAQRLTLPSGAYYQFTYNNASAAELQRIDLPTGGSISYTYSPTCDSNPDGPDSSDTFTQDCRLAVQTRTVQQGGQTATWTYSGGRVTDPYGNDEVHIFGPPGLIGYLGVYELEVQYWSGSSQAGAGGQLLKRVVNSYDFETYNWPVNDFINVRLKQQDTVLENGQTSRVQTDYETYTFSNGVRSYTATRMNPTERREYDFGTPSGNPMAPGAPGPLKRRLTYTYLHTANQPYVDRNIVDRVVEQDVFDGAGNPVAKDINEYDVYDHQVGGQTLAMQSSNAVQHDSTKGVAFTTRGNITANRRWRNTDGAFLNTIHQYDDAGNVIASVDALNNKTSFDFTDSWANAACAPAGQGKAYVTKITNALSQFTTRSYNSCTGSVASATDLNAQTTFFTYDLFGRPITTALPDGGSTINCYSDVGGATCPQSGAPFQVVSTKKITGALNLVDTSLFDGLGRVTQTQVNSDPDGVTYVDTTYDLLGRVHSVSNPHRAAPATTDGVTTYQYDALGRICVVIPPDGTAVPGTTCPSSAPARDVFSLYSANTTTVTDESGKSRKTQTDALGRLTSVWEDPAGLNYQTLYTYDTLSNLTCVEQHGNVTGTGCSSPPTSDSTSPWRVRRFSYNSLSQLLSATNPESGTIGYTYDNNGNPLAKTAPAPNQTGAATVVTSYTYDPLNRLTQQSYNDGSTAAVKYGYDGVALAGCTTAPAALVDSNPIGYRTAMCDGSGATSWKHDELGRALQEKRKIGTAAAQSVIYTYNFDGSLKTLKYPSTATVKYTPSGAGRMLAAQDVANAINYVQNAQYAPFGGSTSMTQGATPITTTNAYNSRLQPITLSSATPAATILSLSYDFHLNSGDNGNVYQIVNNRVGGRTQNFLYDALNRIQQAYSNANSGQISWGETFGPAATSPGVPPSTPGIDAWGNLTNRSGVTGKAHTESALIAAPASVQNRLTGFSYDAAGNMTANGTATYTYDAENRLLTAGGVTYTYDGDGKRVKKSNGTLYWTGTGSDTLAESDLTAAMQKEYIFFNGKRVARRDLSDGSVKYYFSDHLGSASVITNAAGAMPPLEESDYYPYGGEIALTTADPNGYKFTGKERDTESGLDNFGARYDSSSLGRFMSPDEFAGGPVDAISGATDPPGPLPYANIFNPQSLNKYAYVDNNPLRYIDPTGHELKVAPELQDWVTEMRTQSPSFNAELAAHEGPNNPNLTINTGSTPNDPDGSPSIGNTSASIGGGPVVTCSPNCVPTDRPYTYGGATVTVNDSVKGDKSQTQDVLGHEVGHVKDARTNTNQYHQDSQNTQQSKGKTPGCTTNCHDKRPQEQRANQYKNRVNQERKQWQKEHCHGLFHKKCS